jgi:hypothetical protein
MYQNAWNTGKVVIRGKFITIRAYSKNSGKSQINNLITHLKFLKNQD